MLFIIFRHLSLMVVAPAPRRYSYLAEISIMKTRVRFDDIWIKHYGDIRLLLNDCISAVGITVSSHTPDSMSTLTTRILHQLQ